MASANDIGKEIANQNSTALNTRSQIGDLSGGTPYIQFFSDNFIKLRVKRIIREKRIYLPASDVLIWGHPTYGIWGSFDWGDDATAFGSWVVVYDTGDL